MPAAVGREVLYTGFREAQPGERMVKLPHDFTPRDYQKELMQFYEPADRPGGKGGKLGVAVWHRRAGKDLVALEVGARASQRRRGSYWHCLPTYAQAKKAIWNGFRSDGKPIISSCFPDEMLRKAPNDSEMMLSLRNGSTWQLVGSDAIDTLVGANPVGVIFSEYALTMPGSWDLIRPILAQNGGWALFIGTPRGENHFYDLYKLASKRPDMYCRRLTVEDTGVLTKEDVQRERENGMPDAMIRQEFYCDFTAANVGSVYGDLLEQLELAGEIRSFTSPVDGCFTTWDLGIADSTAIWIWRLRDRGVEVVDYIEANGKPFSYFIDEVEKRPYEYIYHWLPHDARARTLVTGASCEDAARSRWGSKVKIGPQLSVPDGIQAGRWLLQQPGTRFHSRCVDRGLLALRAYHYEVTQQGNHYTYSKKPEHDWSSHGADAWRYVGCVMRVTEWAQRPAEVARPPVIPPANMTFCLDDLFTERERSMKIRGRT